MRVRLPSVATGGPPGKSSHDNALTAARERRETERAILYWEQETRRLASALTWITLNFAEMATEMWAYRFIVSVDAAAGDGAFLFYGAKFAAMMRLPDKADPSLPLKGQLPDRYASVFAKGLLDAVERGVPVRMEGEVIRGDGRQELYRSVFIPLSAKSDGRQRLAFGAFNCRVAQI
jgi:hypothetical protein